MTDLSASSAVSRVLPAARPERRALRPAPAAAMGLLTAAVLGAGVLLLPGDSPASAEQLTAVAMVQRPAHPVQPVVPAAEPAAPEAPALQFRDPFLPLVSDGGQSAPVAEPVAAPDTSGEAPQGETPVDVPAPPPTFEFPQEPAPLPPPPAPSTGSPSSGGATVTGSRLSLAAVETAGEDFVAVLSLDGTRMRAQVGGSFGPGGELLLLSLQQGPADGQWTAVVQRGRGEPFDVVTGSPVRLP